jgi:hypothetical protein
LQTRHWRKSWSTTTNTLRSISILLLEACGALSQQGPITGLSL